MAKKKHKKEKEDIEVQDKSEESTTQEEQSEEQSEQKEESSSLQAQYDELNDKYLRLYSDFDNFRKRSIKEKADIIGSASGEVIKEMLEILDDFERAISNNEDVHDADSLKEGFKLIHQKMLKRLEAKGLEPMDAKGDTFDADKHEAITQIPVEDDEMKGKVVDVIERGYNLKGKVLRYAKVVVGQ